MHRRDLMTLHLYTEQSIAPAMEYIKNNLLDDPNFSSIEKIYNELDSKGLIPIDTKTMRKASKDVIDKRMKEYGFVKDRKQKCFIYEPKKAIEIKSKQITPMLRDLIIDYMITITPGMDKYSERNYYTLILTVEAGHENLVAEILMNYSNLSNTTHIIVGRHCVHIGSSNYAEIKGLSETIDEIKVNISNENDTPILKKDLEETN